MHTITRDRYSPRQPTIRVPSTVLLAVASLCLNAIACAAGTDSGTISSHADALALEPSRNEPAGKTVILGTDCPKSSRSKEFGSQPFDDNVGYFDEDGSTPGFSYSIEPDGSKVSINGPINQGNNYEAHNTRADLELKRAFYCEQKALQAKATGDQQMCSTMQKRTADACQVALAEFQKHLEILQASAPLNKVLKGESPDESIVRPFHTYANMAICYALLGKSKEALENLDKFHALGIGNDYDKLGPSDHYRYYSGYKVAMILFAEGKLTEAKELLEQTLADDDFYWNVKLLPHAVWPDRILAWKVISEIAGRQGQAAEKLQADLEASKLLSMLDPDKRQARIESVRMRLAKIGIEPDKTLDSEVKTSRRETDHLGVSDYLFARTPLGAPQGEHFWTHADNINPLVINTGQGGVRSTQHRENFDQHSRNAYIAFSRAMYCENHAIWARAHGDTQRYNDMHKQSVQYAEEALTESKNRLVSMKMPQVVTDDLEQIRESPAFQPDAEPFWTYANIASCQALLGLADSAKKNAIQIAQTFGEYCHAPVACFYTGTILFGEDKLPQAKDVLEKCLAIHNDGCLNSDDRVVIWEILNEIGRREGNKADALKARTEAQKLIKEQRDSESVLPTGNLKSIEEKLLKLGIAP